MTTDDYLDLITSWHRGKPKFSGTVQALVSPIVGAQSVLATVSPAFDLDTAVGAQLDIVGQWVGRTRFVSTPLVNLYFSFDDPLRGFDRGSWKGPYDDASGITRLDDETYRLLLRAKIAANHWDGTIPGAQAALSGLFPASSGSLIYVEDRQDMSIVFGISGMIPPLVTLALFANGYIPLKPEGVRTYYLVTSLDEAPAFGFDVNNSYIGGFDVGAWAVAASDVISGIVVPASP